MSTNTMLNLVELVDSFPYNDSALDNYYRFIFPKTKQPIGLIHLGAVLAMPWTKSFVVKHDRKEILVLPSLDAEDPSQAVTAAFAELINTAIDQDVFRCIGARHSEPFLVPGLPYQVVVERYATSILGTATRGAHLTAFTRNAPGEMRIWVAKRSQHVGTWKGMLDTTVAGGVAAYESAYENIIREAEEEASFPADLIKQRVQQAGVLTYMGRSLEGENGWEGGMALPDIVSVFDMELPEDVHPKPNDEEVEQFYLLSIEQIKTAMLEQKFKPNCAVVMLDFFIRHGIVTIENEPDYVEIVQRMHRQLTPVTTSSSFAAKSDQAPISEHWRQLIKDWQHKSA